MRPDDSRTMDTLLPFPQPTDGDDPATTQELITRRAHEIWSRLGQPQGCDLAIWLEAESEIEAVRKHTFRHPHCPIETA
jgi:hypothetical protein